MDTHDSTRGPWYVSALLYRLARLTQTMMEGMNSAKLQPILAQKPFCNKAVLLMEVLQYG